MVSKSRSAKSPAAKPAASKPAAKAAPPAPTPPPPPQPTPPTSAAPTDERSALAALLARYAPLPAKWVAQFEKLQPATTAQQVGSEHKADKVWRHCITYVVRIDEAREAAPLLAERIRPEWMRWVCDQITLTQTGVEARDRDASSTRTHAASVQAAWNAAKASRNTLSNRLTAVAEGDEVLAASLSTLRSDNLTAANTHAGALKLAEKARDVLADPALADAVYLGALTPATITNAERDAKALKDALDAEQREGDERQGRYDNATINLSEGRAYMTLRRLRTLNVEANKEDPTVPLVQVPKGLERIFATSRPAGEKPSPSDPPPAP